jgi:peroxiredoxin
VARIAPGDRMIPFENLPGVDGRTYSSEDFSSAPLLALFFTCNHCPYVQAWEDRFVAFQREYGSKGVQLVGINPNDDQAYPEDSFEAMVERARKKGFNFPYLRDADQSVARAYGAERTPEFFLFDAERRLIYHGAFDDNYEDPAKVRRPWLKLAVEAALEGRRPEVAETRPVGCSIKWRKPG